MTAETGFAAGGHYQGHNETVWVGDGDLAFADVIRVARDGVRAELTAAAGARMDETRARIQAAINGDEAVYGITTGFGALANTHIPQAARIELQHAILRSHAAGMGPPMPREVVRAMILLRARTLAKGYSGTRPVVAASLLALLNAGITPYVPRYGSLGASGDLAPLAHASLCMTGEGWVLRDDGSRGDAAVALREAGLSPLQLEAKEGLALLNGTDGMLGMLVMACADAAALFRTADLVCALTVEALYGRDGPFDPALHVIRPHPGQARSAANVRRLLANSEILAARRGADDLVQDAYSLRCTPQVNGAARDTLDFAAQVATRELAAAVDNPVILDDGRVESTGNFHGEPLAFAFDFLAIAAAEVGAIAERRTDRLLDVKRSRGLPPFLTPDAGVNSGLMIAQYTAAALVAENRRLAQPASTDSLPTSAMQEDHVSMGWGGALKLRQLLDNLARILAIEAVCAAAGLDFRAPLQPAPPLRAVRDRIRAEIPGPGADRFLAPDLEAAEALIRSNALVTAAESIVGPLD
jgi:histidine ammonia-lyase